MLPNLFYFDIETLELTTMEKLSWAKFSVFRTSNKKQTNLQRYPSRTVQSPETLVSLEEDSKF